MPKTVRLVGLGFFAAFGTVAIAQQSSSPRLNLQPVVQKSPPSGAESFGRFRVTTDQGVFVVYDGTETVKGRNATIPQIAYWNDYAAEQLFFFNQLLRSKDDVAHAVSALHRDLGINTKPMPVFRPHQAGAPPSLLVQDGQWRPADPVAVLTVMGAQIEGAVSAVFWCGPGIGIPRLPDGPLPEPMRGTSVGNLFETAAAMAGCLPPGGGDPPGDPCATAPQPGRCCNPTCSGCSANDCDSDGIPNGSDPDVDGDGIQNGNDGDVDGDGIANGLDCDIDGDGLSDWEDPDADGDSILNEDDMDADGDGTPSWEDPKRNGCEGPCDNNNVYCCGISDPCLCSNVCSSFCNVDCDDGIGCTDDYCHSVNGEVECSSWCQIGSESDGAVAGTCNISFNVEIREITFKNTHEVHENADGDVWAVGPKYAGLFWKYVNNPDRPVCYTKNTKMSLRVKLFVSAGTEDLGEIDHFVVRGPNGIQGEGTYAVNCGNHATEFNVTMDTPLPDEVLAYEPMVLTWEFKKPYSDDWITRTTTHDVYVTYATPLTYNLSNHTTLQRLTHVCWWADGESTLDGIATRIWNRIGQDPPTFALNAGEGVRPGNLWSLFSGSASDCEGLAMLMRLACGTLGVSADVGYVYATRDCFGIFSTNREAHETRWYPMPDGLPDRFERLWFFAGDENSWQAVCKVNNHYYAPKVSHSAQPLCILNALIGNNDPAGNHQCWAFENPQVPGQGICNPDSPVVPLPDPLNPPGCGVQCP